MSSAGEENQDVDRRIADMVKSIAEFRKRSYTNSGYRMANDLQRLARREQRLMPLLHAQFELVNLAQSLFQHHRAREISIEMIALLESPDRARQFQADYSESEYAATCAWMTACAYDNLARHTGDISGFNSDGMHQCIADGIAVCHRTGKLRCIACFREYASDVYLAADDTEMALHHVSVVAAMSENDPGSERRWAGAKNKGKILALMGELEAAREGLVSALQLVETYHTPIAARMDTLSQLESVLWLLGDPDAYRAIAGEPAGSRGLPMDEDCRQDCRWDYRDAVAACCTRDFDKAIDLLTKWDTKLGRDNLAHEWFETRLRLIAAHRLAGKQEKVEALAQPLLKRAEKARDWLTLRRLRRLLDPTEPPSPTAMLASPRIGPFAPAGTTVAVHAPAAVSSEDLDPSSSMQEQQPSPLSDVYEQIVLRLQSSEDGSAEPEVLRQILAIPPALLTDPRDVAAFLHLLPFLFVEGVPFDEMWSWGERAAAPFSQTAYVVSLLAALADAVCSSTESKMEDRIDADRIEALFRQSLDLDPDNALNHARAGAFYLGRENVGEAERCLARGFRLQRSNSNLALRLADIYQHTDRPREALKVLDLCLREGCDDPNVAWEAALTAFRVEQYESLLTYLDRFESLVPDQPWVGHYRAIGLLELAQPEKAVEALALEERRSPERPFGIEILRACAASALGQAANYRQHLERVLAYQWSAIDYFTQTGLASLSERLWNAGSCLPAADEQLARLRRRLLLCGLAPNSLFEPERLARETVDEVHYFRCALLQPLDERWAQSPGCLHGQSDWLAYRCLWGVLARDEDEASRLALAAQAECGPGDATVEEVENLNQQYTDKPGVIWQGVRWSDSDGAGDG